MAQAAGNGRVVPSFFAPGTARLEFSSTHPKWGFWSRRVSAGVSVFGGRVSVGIRRRDWRALFRLTRLPVRLTLRRAHVIWAKKTVIPNE